MTPPAEHPADGLKILTVSPYFESHRGGVEIVAGRLAREFRRLGHEVTWLASDATPAPANGSAGGRAVAVRALNTTEAALGLPFPLPAPSALARLQREIARADVVHLHDSLTPIGVAAAWLGRRAGKPVVVTQHIGAIPYRNPVLRGLMAAALRFLSRPLLEGADQVVFISEITARHFADAALRTPPRLIFNGVDVGVFRPAEPAERPALRAGLGLASHRPMALFVGRFVEKKGLGTLERLARLSPEVDFALAGWGPLDPSRWKLPNVRVYSELSGASLAALYRCSDVLVLPSVGEGFPLVLQEALACGLPGLCGAETAQADAAARPYLRGVPIEAGQPDATARAFHAALLELLAAPPDAGAAAARADFARRRYAWPHAAAEYAGLFRALAGIRPAHACARQPAGSGDSQREAA